MNNPTTYKNTEELFKHAIKTKCTKVLVTFPPAYEPGKYKHLPERLVEAMKVRKVEVFNVGHPFLYELLNQYQHEWIK